MYQPKEIEEFYSAWRGEYRENDDRGESCVNFVFGDQWDPSIIQDRALRGEESLIFNIAQKHLLRVKGEAEKLELNLKIQGENLDPKLLKEGRHVLNRLVLSNDHLSAFQEVLGQVYDHGYGVLLVSTKQTSHKEPFEEPFLRVIKDPRQCFFDVSCKDDFKTEGRYCGIVYNMPYKDLLPSEYKKYGKNSNKSCEITDFWYREPYLETWFFDKQGKWSKVESPGYLVKKKIRYFKTKFIRVIDGEIHEGPIDYYTHTKLPLVYWKGLEGSLKYGAKSKTKTLPYIYPLVDAQAFTNYVGSALVGRLKKLGGTKIILTSQMIEGKENFWSDFNRRSGVVQVNESDDGNMQQPMVLPPESVDANLLNTLQLSMQLMDQLAGINAAQQGEQAQVTTSAGLHRQIMQGNILQNVILSNHLRAINEVGRILTEMIPGVIIEERNLSEGLVVNKRGEKHTPSNPEIRNDVKELFSKLNFSIEFGASSDAEKGANLVAIKEIISTNPNIAPYFADEFAANLNTANSEKLKRRMEALMPQGIQEVGEGMMSVEEYRQMVQQQQQEAQKQLSLQEQSLELQKQKVQGDQQIKQAELQLKAAKMQQQGAKDAQNINIKKAGVLAKLSPDQPKTH